MSITIHFKGKIRSPTKIESLTTSIKSIADELKWEYKIFDEDFMQPIALKGIILRPHPKSEWLNMLFDKHGQLNDCVRIQLEHRSKKFKSGKWNFIKTQFAPNIFILPW